MRRIFTSEQTSDFIQKRKNKNIFQASNKKDDNVSIMNNLNGRIYSKLNTKID